MKQLSLFSIFFLIYSNLLFSEEYSFDASEFEKKVYEFSGELKTQQDLVFLNTSSRSYLLNFWAKEQKDYFDSYLASIQLKGSYEFEKLKFSGDLKNQLFYTKDDEFENDFDLYEGYFELDFFENTSLQIGKKNVKWGKGYIYNPVAFCGREKDINDVDAGQEGFWMTKIDYLKSFDMIVKNLSITPIFIPVRENINDDFYLEESNNFILKNYFLIGDVDFDTYILINDKEQQKLGIDFALNILPNWEVHGEYAFEGEKKLKYISSDFKVLESSNNIQNYIFGSRILLETNTTIFLEYLHHDQGLEKGEMENYYKAIDGLSTQAGDITPSQLKRYQLENLNSQFLMKDYGYLKLSHPEPFDILYFTPSVFILYNLVDKSRMIGGEFGYSRFENIDLKLKYFFLSGDDYSEFGDKMNSNKVSMLFSYVF